MGLLGLVLLMGCSSLTVLPSDRAEFVLQVYLLGLVDFESLLSFQRRLVYQVRGVRDCAALVLCEHLPLITVGRHGSWSHILYEPAELSAREWPVRWVNRGGGCHLHVPGQLAIYSVVALDRCRFGLQEYVAQLQRVLVAVLDDFGVHAGVRSGHAGVWVGDRPIASVGVAVRDWVTYFGAVLNVSPSLEPFRRIRSGLPVDGPMTSLERERRAPLRASLVRERLLEHFAASFGVTRTSLFCDHPSLDRKAPADAVASRS